MSFRKPALIALAFVFVASASILPIAIAQEGPQAGSSGLQLSPTRSELVGQPGEARKFSVVLKNVTQTAVVAQAVLSDFESDGISGTPKIIVEEREERSPYSIASMLTTLADVELQPGETKEIEHTINIPGNVAPGAYFGALRYASVPKSQVQSNADQRQVALTASVAHLVLVEVPGDIVEQIQVENLDAQKDGKSGTLFFTAPNQVAASIKNLGNGFSRPFGQVSVKNFSGNEVAKYDLNNTEPRGIVLPNSSRIFTDQVSNIKIPGRYTINASVAYGNGGEVVNYKSTFWYMPFWFLALIVLLLGAIGAGAYTIYKKRTRVSTKRR